jgi:hypothetical protein
MLVEIGNSDVSPPPRIEHSDRAADARVAAGDQRDHALELADALEHHSLLMDALARTLPRGADCAALHASKLVFAGSFSLSFLLTKITRRFTSHRLCGRLRFFLSASTTEKAAN